MKKQQSDQIAMLLESQYNQFKEDLSVGKPRGGTAFITDFEKKDKLAITYAQAAASAAEDKNKPVALGAPVALAAPPPSKTEEEKMLENSDLPKF